MLNSTILQQVFVVEFVVQNQMCEVCHRQAAQDYWNALVQVRQKVHNCIPTEVVQKKLCWGSQSRNVLMAGASFVFKNERRCYNYSCFTFCRSQFAEN